ncbi:S-adenosyl-L-methionine-dependent methyltransferases superfamily protein [Tasmannia lanceolata]|uniref:S-adenosyl-L-methionine-dependent methyltransferases superfamily protein n=1 Tax=Tasmannia lanceolata TaxID=3420 RepID=UPI00406406BB
MKPLGNTDTLSSPLIIKLFIFAFASIAFFYLGKRWIESDGYDQLVFFNSNKTPQSSSSVIISPNANKTFDIDALISNTSETVPIQTLIPPPSDLPPPPPPPVRFGIIDENGTMREDFDVGGFDPDQIENWGNWNGNGNGNGNARVRVSLKRFPLCSNSMREYIPCLDNVEEIKKLKSTEKGEKYERHCPAGPALDCLVPAPKNYKTPIPWPRSRDEVWFSNVPHPRLVEDKGGQNWISIYKDKFKFPGGGTQFIHGADQYLDQMSQMVPDIAFGHHTRVVLDVGCGVASFGAFLLSRNVIPLSVAPKDVHENQIQFALERGVPAMVAAFATRRLLYPSQAFDLIHCSRCRINWTRDDGILLLEVDRMLRAGGYFAWAAQPVYKHEEPQQEAWKEMEDLTTRICWVLVKKEGYLAIWQKPLNNSCYLSRVAGVQPPLCDTTDNPDNVWYVDLKPCITRLPENGYGANVTTWPARLHYPPDRLQSVEMDAYMAKKELFKAESKYWNGIVESYVRAYHWKKIKLRNVLDMRASFGGFAAAMNDLGIDCWVMNVVPVSGPNTLPVIYDRGLIGVLHDWCEPFDTYPRTYDLLHASGLFSIEKKRCNITNIVLEMDRILRPGGRAVFRDSKSVIEEVKEIAEAMGWRTALHDTSEGPYASRRILMCDKQLLRA